MVFNIGGWDQKLLCHVRATCTVFFQIYACLYIETTMTGLVFLLVPFQSSRDKQVSFEWVLLNHAWIVIQYNSMTSRLKNSKETIGISWNLQIRKFTKLPWVDGPVQAWNLCGKHLATEARRPRSRVEPTWSADGGANGNWVNSSLGSLEPVQREEITPMLQKIYNLNRGQELNLVGCAVWKTSHLIYWLTNRNTWYDTLVLVSAIKSHKITYIGWEDFRLGNFHEDWIGLSKWNCRV